jgi:hypothetical protein
MLSFCILPFGLIGGVMGLMVTLVAERDLRRIREGTLDPAGLDDADLARHRGTRGLILSIFGLVIGLILLWWAVSVGFS